jgi:glycerol-3-phosphate dehydrogenase (NAD(P)+)
MKVGIIGAGAWGTALGVIVARGGADVSMWSYDGEYKVFDGVTMPENLRITQNMSDMANMDAWLIVTPAAFFRETLVRAREFYKGVPIIICTKGAEPQTGEFMSEILADVLPECVNVGVLSGPQFAAEVACGVPTGSTIAGNEIARGAGHKILNKLYLSDTDDIVGVQMCGVGKNAVALVAGYNFVAAAGENERAMIFTRAWGEVAALGRKMGARAETFLDLCGVGDLFLSATSETSRNFSGGMAIARGAEMVGTVEGVSALRGLIARAEKLGVQTPILCAMRDKMGL